MVGRMIGGHGKFTVMHRVHVVSDAGCEGVVEISGEMIHASVSSIIESSFSLRAWGQPILPELDATSLAGDASISRRG